MKVSRDSNEELGYLLERRSSELREDGDESGKVIGGKFWDYFFNSLRFEVLVGFFFKLVSYDREEIGSRRGRD